MKESKFNLDIFFMETEIVETIIKKKILRKCIFTACGTCARERFQTHLQMKTGNVLEFFFFLTTL